MQNLAPAAGATKPGGHFGQATIPKAGAKCPGSHFVHSAVEPAACVPGAQGTHTAIDPLARVPGPQVCHVIGGPWEKGGFGGKGAEYLFAVGCARNTCYTCTRNTHNQAQPQSAASAVCAAAADRTLHSVSRPLAMLPLAQGVQAQVRPLPSSNVVLSRST